MLRSLLAVACLARTGLACAAAQDRGTLDPKPLPPLAHPDDPATPAKELFGRAVTPADLAARSIGFYSRGCLAGGEALPVNGEAWQVMRLSRNRNWGNPALVSFLERFAKRVPKVSHWPGILVGDMSQPRGGPMFTGHASHQIGLDADIWLTPMPDHTLSREDARGNVGDQRRARDGLDVDQSRWTPDHLAVIRAAAQSAAVERIFVNAAIKKAICREATGDRVVAQQGAPDVGAQLPLPHPHGLSGRRERLHRAGSRRARRRLRSARLVVPAGGPAPAPLDTTKKKPPMTMAALPQECRAVLKAR